MGPSVVAKVPAAVSHCPEAPADVVFVMFGGQYVRIRDTVRRRALESNDGGSQQTVPITVRQLEALVRISESLAKMRLQQEVCTTLRKR